MQILLLLLTEFKTAYLKTIIMKQKIIRGGSQRLFINYMAL